MQIADLRQTPSIADSTGMIADLGVGALLGIVLGLAGRIPRHLLRFVVGGLWLTVWATLAQGNYEHIRTLGSVMSGFYAEFLTNPTFLWGSALDLSRPGLLIVNLLAVWVAWWLVSRSPRTRDRSILLSFGVGLILCSVAVLLPPSSRAAQWRQQNFVLQNIRWAAFSEELVAQDVDLPGLFPADLDGSALPISTPSRPNVLLVVLEGVSGAYVDPVAAYHELEEERPRLESLSKLSATGLSYVNFLNHQRQTNRGLYTILCGDIPKLVTQEPKMTELGWGQSPLPCLPNELAAAGYETLFIQAAPLGFMSKDRFMPRAGFTRVLGDGFFRRKRSSTGKWGVDDREFLLQTLPLLEQLQEGDRTWFATLLTSGTHHPFNVPADFRSEHEPKTFAHAVAFLDHALADFLADAERRGLLDRTIVIITSDESFGLERPNSATELALSQAWGTLTIVGPGIPQKVVTQVFHQSDIALTVMDLLGLADQARALGGRSAIRKYANARAVAFGNTYLRTLFGFDGSTTLYACTEDFSGCRGFEVDATHLFRPLGAELPATPEQVAFMKRYAGRSLLVASRPDDEAVWHLITRPNPIDPKTLPAKSRGFRELFGNQYISLEAGNALIVDVEVEVEGAAQGFEAFHAVWAVPRDKMPSGARFRADLEQESERLRLGDSTLGMRPRFAPWANTYVNERFNLPAGTPLRLHYELRAKEDLERVDARLNLKLPVDAKINVTRATLRIERGSSGRAGVTRFEDMSESE